MNAGRAYGAALGGGHALTAVAFFTYKHVTDLASGEDCVCWPLVPDCYTWRAWLSPALVRGAVLLYLGLGLATAATFLRGWPERRARLLLLASCMAGTCIYLLDYRLRFNQVTMLAWASSVYLLTPARARLDACRLLVVLFYVWAGTLKLTPEWWTGAALYASPWLLPASLVPAACKYVLVLELVFVWGIFSSRPWLRWAVYAQILLFHVVSWGVVGWYYPCLMVALTAVFPLTWGLPGPTAPALAAGGAFSLAQVAPLLIAGDSAVTGEGRVFALHMFDARVECAGGATLTAGRASAQVALINPGLDTRTRCDPIVILETTRRLCRNLAARGQVARVDVSVHARKTSEPALRPLVHIDDACVHPPRYSLFGHNPWIVR